eukprot:gene8600-425_t
MSTNLNLPDIDLSQSTIEDVYRAFKDKSKAESTLSQFREEQKKERDEAIKFVQETYPKLDGQIIICSLIQHDWNAEKVIIDLLVVNDELLREEEEEQNKLLPTEEEIVLDDEEEEEEEEIKPVVQELKPEEPAPEEEKTETYQETEVKVEPVKPTRIYLKEIDIKASQNDLKYQEQFTLEFTNKEVKQNTKAWVGMYVVGEKKDGHYITYQWVASAIDSKLTFNAPNYPCKIEFKYFNRKFNKAEITSKIEISVGPQFQILSVIKDKKIHGGWTQTSGEPKIESAWVGLYEVNEKSNSKYIAYQKTTIKENQFIFETPITPKDYEVRLFTSSMLSNYNEMGRSAHITVTGIDSLSLKKDEKFIIASPDIVTIDPYTSSSWIGLFKVEQVNSKLYVDYTYLVDRTKEISFKIPKAGGKYEVRIFTNSGYENVLIRSNSIEIEEKEEEVL